MGFCQFNEPGKKAQRGWISSADRFYLFPVKSPVSEEFINVYIEKGFYVN